MLKLSDNIFFSTEVQPSKNITPNNWWYVMPETGQHVALYSITSLKNLAERHNLNFYTNGKNLHLFTKKKINNFIFRLVTIHKLSIIIDLLLKDNPSLLSADYNSIKSKNL